jgi:hypothetical protein
MEAIQPLLDLLGGNSKSVITTVIAWLVALRLALVFAHGYIQRWMSDVMNKVAASETHDDDEFLLALFNKGWYKTLVFVGLVVGWPLPSKADLERAIRLQQEAAGKEQPVPVTGTNKANGGLAMFLVFALGLGLTGCAGPDRLEPGGAYAPTITNSVGQVTPTAAPDLALFLSDSTYDLAYSSALTAFRLEKNNRILLAKLFPDLKREMDRMRDQVWEADGQWANARQAYLTNPVPANLSALERTIAEMQRLSATAQTLLPKESP